MRLLEEIRKNILAREKEADRLLEDINEERHQRSKSKQQTFASFRKSTSISQGTAATDNLSSMMKNTVVGFGSDIKVVSPPSPKQADGGTTVVRHDS